MEHVKNYLLIFFLTCPFFLIPISCSDNRFSTLPNPKCDQLNASYGAGTCKKIEGGGYQISGEHQTGAADILFVVDNSGSMYEQQNKMAQRFSNFYQKIKHLDFKIAIITTDVSASPQNERKRAGNGYGEFQDGKFLTFPNGKKTLSREDCSESNEESCISHFFTQTLVRKETLGCNTNISKDYDENCPSGDERAIYALNLALDSGSKDFFRENATLHFVILSDEDERGTGGERLQNLVFRELEPYDLPSTLVQKVQSQLGPLKLFTVHSIIVPPLSTAVSETEKESYKRCYEEQNNELVSISNRPVYGQFGDLYSALSQPQSTLKQYGSIDQGHIGSICDSDYSESLGEIGHKVQFFKTQLLCKPVPHSLQMNFSPQPSFDIQTSIDNNNILTITPNPGPQTVMKWTYTCPNQF